MIDFGLYETALEIGMDDAGCGGSLVVRPDRPGSALIRSCGKESPQAE